MNAPPLLTPFALVRQARTYIDTPYTEGARLPGVGLDCLGVLLALVADFGFPPIAVPRYGAHPDPAVLRHETAKHLRPIAFAELAPADVITFDIMRREQHYGLVTTAAPLHFLHAYAPAGRVLEQPLDPVWRRRVRGCWRLPATALWPARPTQ